MNNIIKFITDFFCADNAEPVGLCSFEKNKSRSMPSARRRERRKELRLSELMEQGAGL